jgi:copper chaperone CopZ
MKTQTLLKRLKGIPKVYPLTSPRSGDAVKNQVEISMDNGTVFQSYSSTIAIKHKGITYLTKDFDYSVTTSKYLKQFCGKSAKEIKAELKNGTTKFKMLE